MFASADPGGLGGTDLEFRNALTSLGNFTTAIIDLRGNGGGSVDQCLAMTDDLIASGINLHELAHYWDSTGHVARVDTTTDSLYAGCPNQPNCTFENHKYVFLQDSGSASCSEIMLTGIKNNSNFPLVGTYSYGKGIAQNLWETPAKGLAVVTTTEFRDKNWKSYHHIGIEPTYFVADPDSQLALAVRLASGDTTALARRSVSSLPDAAIARLNWNLGKRQLKILPGAWRLQRGEMR
jgi:C-terminal processing protease CtpA/Prc